MYHTWRWGQLCEVGFYLLPYESQASKWGAQARQLALLPAEQCSQSWRFTFSPVQMTNLKRIFNDLNSELVKSRVKNNVTILFLGKMKCSLTFIHFRMSNQNIEAMLDRFWWQMYEWENNAYNFMLTSSIQRKFQVLLSDPTDEWTRLTHSHRACCFSISPHKAISSRGRARLFRPVYIQSILCVLTLC